MTYKKSGKAVIHDEILRRISLQKNREPIVNCKAVGQDLCFALKRMISRLPCMDQKLYARENEQKPNTKPFRLA